MFGENTRNFVLTKIEYGSPQWQVSLATSFKEGADTYDGYYHTSAADVNADVTAYGLRAYWKPDTTGAIPEVQIGYETATIDNAAVGQAEDTDGWMIGFGWKDLFVDGNRAGIAIGSRQAASSIKGGGSDPVSYTHLTLPTI